MGITQCLLKISTSRHHIQSYEAMIHIDSDNCLTQTNTEIGIHKCVIYVSAEMQLK